MRIATLCLSLLSFAAPATVWAASEFIVVPPDSYQPQYFKHRSREIDPNQGAYGLPFNAGEAEMIKAFGPPSGVFQASEIRKAFFYGKSHIFVLKNGKFKELYVSDHMLDWDFAKNIEPHPFFDSNNWEVKPGLKKGMEFQQVKAKVGNSLGAPSYQVTYTTDRANLMLRFSGTSSPGREGGEYHLYGFSLRAH